MSEAEIITRILSGEEDLFTRIVNRYSGYVWALCSSYVRNPSDCEDVVQEVFVQCYRRLDTLRNRAAFGGWLSQLARRHCLMWLRTSARRDRCLVEYGNGIEVGHGQMGEAAMGNAAQEELHEGIREAIDALPPDYREALMLRFTEGYSVDEAASFLGISAAAMRKRLERAQNMLKDRLWDYVEPALAKGKHSEHLAGGILAAIPFGKAPWLGASAAGVAASTTAVSKLGLLGGIAVMSNKMVIGLGAVAVMLGLVFVVANRVGHSRVATPTVGVSKSEETPPAAPVPRAENVAEGVVAGQTPSQASSAVEPVKKEKKVSEGSAKAVRPASVSGCVRDDAGRPLADANIHLAIGREGDLNDVVKTCRATSGTDGKYEIKGIETFGRSVAYASGEGYGMQFNTVNVAEGRQLKDVNFRLKRAPFSVAGHVVTEGGLPIPEASVDMMYYGYDEEGLLHTAATGQTTGNIGGVKLLFATTDKNGFFTLAIPLEGLCDFRVIKEEYGPGFFPKIPTGTDDAKFVLYSGGAIAGKVTTADGKSAPGVTVRVTGQALPGGLTASFVKVQALPVQPVVATTDADGAYLAKGLGADYVYTAVVPATDVVDEANLPTEQGVREITRMAREFDEMMFSAESFSAKKTDIRVQAGQTTPGVDLVIGSEASATIRGTVTDKSSGKPACPVVVTASSVDGGWLSWFAKKSRSKFAATAVTGLDGAYVLQIHQVSEKAKFRIGYEFMTEGGSAWDQPDEEIATLELGPGDDHELDFSVDGPLTVPVRYVGTDGKPCAGILAAVRRAGGSGGCGGTLISGPDGRVTFHGIRSGVDLQAIAWVQSGSDLQTVGVSEPFSGKPGETVSEVTVVCRLLGGIEGTLVFPDGRPAANAGLLCGAQAADGSTTGTEGAESTDAAGHFTIGEAFQEGHYSGIAIGFLDDQSAAPYSVTVPNVDIVAGTVVDVGTLVVGPEKDLLRVVTATDWGHKGNMAIAATYTKEGLEALPEPDLILKTGMALYEAGRYQDALDAFTKMTEVAKDRELYSAVSLIWQGQMLDLMGRRDEAVAAYGAAADMNVTDRMRHDQYGMAYSPKDYAAERMHDPFTRVENHNP